MGWAVSKTALTAKTPRCPGFGAPHVPSQALGPHASARWLGRRPLPLDGGPRADSLHAPGQVSGLPCPASESPASQVLQVGLYPQESGFCAWTVAPALAPAAGLLPGPHRTWAPHPGPAPPFHPSHPLSSNLRGLENGASPCCHVSVIRVPSPSDTCRFRKSPTEDLSPDFLVLLALFPPGHIYLVQDRIFHFPVSQNQLVVCFSPLWALGMSGNPSSGHYCVSLLGHRLRGTDFSASSLESMKGSAAAAGARFKRGKASSSALGSCPAVSSLPDIKQRGNQGFLNWGS